MLTGRRAARSVFSRRKGGRSLASLATRAVRRETLRLAAFLCTTPFCTERMITGSASLRAATAVARSPA